MRSRHGFVLAELVTAVVIIAVLMGVTASVILMCSEHVGNAHAFFTARQVASNHLETMTQLSFDDLQLTSDAGDEFESALGAQLKDFSGNVRVEEFDGNPALKKITVTVQWRGKRRARELSLSVLKGERTP